ncbi:MAG: sulfite exporter TauE/SafE family protein [Candidatus Gracilibacteria bacterium]
MEIFLLTILGFIMGFVTSVSGGAGVFAVPTLLAFGIPPINVLALNRMSDVGVVFGALRNYWKAKVIQWRLAIKIIPFMALGSFIGANLIVNLADKSIKTVVLIGVIIGMIFLIKPARPFLNEGGTSKFKKMLGFFMLFVVGIWSGAIAMAGATFAVLVLVYLFGKNYVDARGTDIAAAIPETLISAGILISASNVNYVWLLTMFISSFLGAFVGSHMAVKRGDSFIKKGMILIAVLMIIKIVFKF